MKKLLSIMLITILVASATLSANADSIIKSSKIEAIETKVSEMTAIMYPELSLENDKVAIGSKITSYYLENDIIKESQYESYPLYINGTIEGIINTVVANNEVKTVSLGVEYANELKAAIKSNTSGFAVLYDRDDIYICFENGTVSRIKSNIAGGKDIATISNLVSSSNITYSKLAQFEPLTIYNPANTRTVYYNSIYTAHVSNENYQCCSNGICWAACMAMASNYFNDTSYTAGDVHSITGCVTASYHNNFTSFIRRLGMSSDGAHYYNDNDCFSYSVLKTYIDSDTLLLLDLQTNPAQVAHEVLAHGYYYNTSSGSKYFYYNDPNGGSLLGTFPSNASDDVIITLDGYTYYVHCYITASA